MIGRITLDGIEVNSFTVGYAHQRFPPQRLVLFPGRVFLDIAEDDATSEYIRTRSAVGVFTAFLWIIAEVDSVSKSPGSAETFVETLVANDVQRSFRSVVEVLRVQREIFAVRFHLLQLFAFQLKSFRQLRVVDFKNTHERESGVVERFLDVDVDRVVR